MPPAGTHVMVSRGATFSDEGVGVGDGLEEGDALELGVAVGVGDGDGEVEDVGVGDGAEYAVIVPFPLFAA